MDRLHSDGRGALSALKPWILLAGIALWLCLPAFAGAQILRTVVHDFRVGSPSNEITLWEWNQQGFLVERRSGNGGNNWTAWNLLQSQSTVSYLNVMLGWYDGNRRINGEFFSNFVTGQFFTPWEVNTTFHWTSMTSPYPDYDARAGFTWRQGTTGRLNFFGTSSPSATDRLVEHWWDGSQWNWTDHGSPPDLSIDPYFGLRLLMGPQSAVWNNESGEGFVFIRAFLSPAAPKDMLVCRYWNGAQWSWVDLGCPDNVDYFNSTPVAITWTSSRSGASYTSVFVVGYNSASGGYLLYERDWSHSTGQWSGWITHTPPVLRFNVSGFLFPYWMGWVPFDLVAGVKWTQNTPGGPVDRFNFFGSAESFTSPSGAEPGTLVEFAFDGANWNWGYDTPPGLPATQKFWTQTAAVLDSNGNQYFGVYGTTADSQNNPLHTVWERFYMIQQGAQSGWFWRNLTN